ncbi:MAG: response regulator [Elainella sp. Prado103]|jgi:CheY-like chemotaxis protein|nr:response regulator [Elainella sp. Prado103]
MAAKQILLIDQETEVRQILHLCLQHLGGWDVTSVSSTQDGWTKLAAKLPDAIVLDILIPTTEQGLQFIQDLKNHPYWCSLPIVLITARAKWLSLQQMQQMGVCGVIAKPFNPIILPKQIADLLQWSAEKCHNA